MRRTWFTALVLALAAVACRGTEPAREEPARPPTSTIAPPTKSAPATTAVGQSTAKQDTRPKIVILGDSLTAGLGLPTEEAYPTLLQERLNKEGLTYEVVNAGVSVHTSAGGLARLDWALQGDVRILRVALGGNDALRGLPPDALNKNLAEIVEHAQARRIRVVLAGMEAPPIYGRDYI